MFSKKEKYLIRDRLKRASNIKYRYLVFLSKSFVKNNQILNNKKSFMRIKNDYKNFKKISNVCVLSGENTSVSKKLLISRFFLNSFSVKNYLQNYQINS